MKKAEVECFDKSAHRRTVYGQIPMKTDIRSYKEFYKCEKFSYYEKS